jgi:hypothetical protein
VAQAGQAGWDCPIVWLDDNNLSLTSQQPSTASQKQRQKCVRQLRITLCVPA